MKIVTKEYQESAFQIPMWEEQKRFMKKEKLKTILNIIVFFVCLIYLIIDILLLLYTKVPVITFTIAGLAAIFLYGSISSTIELFLASKKFNLIVEYKNHAQIDKIIEIITEHGPKPISNKDSKSTGLFSRFLVRNFDRNIDRYIEKNPDVLVTSNLVDTNSNYFDPQQYLPLRAFSYWYCALSALSDMTDEKSLVQVYRYTTLDNNYVLQLYSKRAIRHQAEKFGFSDINQYISYMNLLGK